MKIVHGIVRQFIHGIVHVLTDPKWAIISYSDPSSCVSSIGFLQETLTNKKVNKTNLKTCSH
jgi:hypothetical protein